MAGSYNHIVTPSGNLASNKTVANTLENGGDVYEAVEEMYGMIWYIADNFGAPGAPPSEVKRIVELARENYKEGLEISRDIHRKAPGKGGS